MKPLIMIHNQKWDKSRYHSIKEELEKEAARIEAGVPGTVELRAAQDMEYFKALEADSTFYRPEQVGQIPAAELEVRYPRAALYLTAETLINGDTTTDDERVAATLCMDALIEGAPLDEAITIMWTR